MTFSQFVQDNLFLFILLAALVVAIIVYEIRNKDAGGQGVTSILAARMINDGAYLIDTRNNTEFKKGHIAGARNHPADKFPTSVERIKAKRDQPVIIYCQTGLTAKTQARLMREQGYEQVYILTGGIQGWRDENLPTVKS